MALRWSRYRPKRAKSSPTVTWLRCPRRTRNPPAASKFHIGSIRPLNRVARNFDRQRGALSYNVPFWLVLNDSETAEDWMEVDLTVETLIERVLDREGGYVNHPADKGGPTCFGITEAVARAHDGAREDRIEFL